MIQLYFYVIFDFIGFRSISSSIFIFGGRVKPLFVGLIDYWFELLDGLLI